jgi:uncharacterized flavoprotein (TIGR03862 family)
MNIIIIGAGPASLMAATQFSIQGHDVTIIEKQKTPGRKFLVAGNGGFNLSHAGELDDFLLHYSCDEIQEVVRQFTNQQLRVFLDIIQIPTYVGSSGKIFPEKHIKPYQVLERWITFLKQKKVQFLFNTRMIDFTNQLIVVENSSGTHPFSFDKLILGLGGSSWSKTGSDGAWVTLFQEKGIKIEPLTSSNTGVHITLNTTFLEKWEGSKWKNVTVSHNNMSKQGDVIITNYGIEGAPIYHCNASLRQFPEKEIRIDFKPQFSLDKVKEVLLKASNNTQGLKQLKLSEATIDLLKTLLSKEEFVHAEMLAIRIKNFPLKFQAFRPIEEAISVAGGVSWCELNSDLSIKKFPNIHLVGEMLNWDAPTGGYLLQACFATGYVAAQNRR